MTQQQIRKADKAIKIRLVERMRGEGIDTRTPSGKQLPY